jgi:hypothetical protein
MSSADPLSPWEKARPFDKIATAELEQLVQKTANGVLGLAVEIRELQKRKGKLKIQLTRITSILRRRKDPKWKRRVEDGFVLYNLWVVLSGKMLPPSEPKAAKWYIVSKDGRIAPTFEVVLHIPGPRGHFRTVITTEIDETLTLLVQGAELADFRARFRGLRHHKSASKRYLRDYFLARREVETDDAPLPERLLSVEAKHDYRNRGRQKAQVREDSGSVQGDEGRASAATTG